MPFTDAMADVRDFVRSYRRKTYNTSGQKCIFLAKTYPTYMLVGNETHAASAFSRPFSGAGERRKEQVDAAPGQPRTDTGGRNVSRAP
ncbi:hypothetical protein EDC90_104011 [Martelella mediterranea]|uniref:Uncharacterized protein n=1 Tax=Martelella mediterranea TaxID=293089 RepID=A0A4R3NNJ0_9HYPH|nr:hypothetical protein EDC90_104011 [Martelella mediterranea]